MAENPTSGNSYCAVKGGIVSRVGTGSTGLLLGCCLLAAVSGCSFHRTEHGFILRSGRWTLQRDSEIPDLPAKDAADKPEVLPWRNRLKGYHLVPASFMDASP